MAKIEIDINEYNSLNTRIKNLENEVVDKNNKLEIINNLNNELKDSISYLVNDTTFFDRVLRWKIIRKIVNSELNKNGYIKNN